MSSETLFIKVEEEQPISEGFPKVMEGEDPLSADKSLQSQDEYSNLNHSVTIKAARPDYHFAKENGPSVDSQKLFPSLSLITECAKITPELLLQRKRTTNEKIFCKDYIKMEKDSQEYEEERPVFEIGLKTVDTEDPLSVEETSNCNNIIMIKQEVNSRYLEEDGDEEVSLDAQKKSSSNPSFNTEGATLTQDILHCTEDMTGASDATCDRLVDSHRKVDPEGKYFPCEVCSRIFVHKCRLKDHLLIHTGEKPYACTVCNKRFRQNTNLTQHMRVHLGEKLHVCTVCSKSFTAKSYLKQHLMIHTEEKVHSCDLCGMSFALKSYLKRHMNMHTDKLHVCPVCHESFSFKSTLKQHLQCHTGEMPYTCDVCNKSFTYKKDLEHHLLIHTKSNLCEICSRSFTRRSTLKLHMKAHMGEKPHECHVCQKSFLSKSVLNQHLLTHTGEKPHSCGICSKSFSQKSNLKSHMKVHVTWKS